MAPKKRRAIYAQKNKNDSQHSCDNGFFLGLTFYVQAGAQSLFRCGKTYQDRPCDTGQETRILSPRGPNSSGIPVSADGSCTQRGAEAQKIVWSREAGALLEQQLAKATSSGERKLIVDVYNRRGTSSEIRTSIEADCIVEKERAARLAELIGTSPPSAKATDAADPIRQKDAYSQNHVKSGSLVQRTGDAESKKIRCDRLKERLENVRASQRVGGNAATMNMLSTEKLDIEKQLNQGAC